MRLINIKTKVKAKYVLSYSNGENKLIENGCVIYENQDIVFVGKQSEVINDDDCDEVIDESNNLLLPGFIENKYPQIVWGCLQA